MSGWRTNARRCGASHAMLCAVVSLLVLAASVPAMAQALPVEDDTGSNVMPLPEPAKTGAVSVEQAIAQRRSIREFTDEQMTIKQLSQLLWAAQGITDEERFMRAAPSAGAKYPMEIFVVAGKVTWLGAGVYRYRPETHALVIVKEGDVREALHEEALSQEWIKDAAVSIVITGVYGRTMEKYGERGVRYVHIEVGAVAENIYLQAESLGLGTTLVGAFSDEGVLNVLGVSGVAPLGIMPVGAPR